MAFWRFHNPTQVSAARTLYLDQPGSLLRVSASPFLPAQGDPQRLTPTLILKEEIFLLWSRIWKRVELPQQLEGMGVPVSCRRQQGLAAFWRNIPCPVMGGLDGWRPESQCGWPQSRQLPGIRGWPRVSLEQLWPISLCLHSEP